MNQELGRVTDLLKEFETQRGAKLDVLSGVLAQQREGIAELTQTTQGLREALSSSKARGQWGERMAEDVLQLAGFVEGIQYRKQVSVEGGRGIPDFTFLLPRGVVMYMDVKFPLDAYMRYLDAESELDQRRHRDDFLRAVRAKVKELAARTYNQSEAETVDCVLLFIPNEQLYGFIQEHDASLLEDALGHKIVMCSPLTLFAVLAVVRQAVDSFRLERTTSEILDVLGSFSKQWEAFGTSMDTLGKRLESTSSAFDQLTGPRRRQLERQLDRIEDLRTDQALAINDPQRHLILEA
jgi:DNA recombination protein RmuC